MKCSFLIILVVWVNSISAETWSPNPKFNIEGSSYTETLIFVSGLTYALTETNNELIRQKKSNFACNLPSSIGSKLLINILNRKHNGEITSEQAISSVMQGLKEMFPCK